MRLASRFFSNSQPQPLCFKINVPRNKPLHLLLMSTSHRYYKVQVVFGALTDTDVVGELSPRRIPYFAFVIS